MNGVMDWGFWHCETSTSNIVGWNFGKSVMGVVGNQSLEGSQTM